MSTHKVGDKVRATTSAQGLLRGETYEVVHVWTGQAFAGGTISMYSVKRVGRDEVLAITNGHIVLQPIEEKTNG